VGGRLPCLTASHLTPACHTSLPTLTHLFAWGGPGVKPEFPHMALQTFLTSTLPSRLHLPCLCLIIGSLSLGREIWDPWHVQHLHLYLPHLLLTHCLPPTSAAACRYQATPSCTLHCTLDGTLETGALGSPPLDGKQQPLPNAACRTSSAARRAIRRAFAPMAARHARRSVRRRTPAAILPNSLPALASPRAPVRGRAAASSKPGRGRSLQFWQACVCVPHAAHPPHCCLHIFMPTVVCACRLPVISAFFHILRNICYVALFSVQGWPHMEKRRREILLYITSYSDLFGERMGGRRPGRREGWGGGRGWKREAWREGPPLPHIPWEEGWESHCPAHLTYY